MSAEANLAGEAAFPSANTAVFVLVLVLLLLRTRVNSEDLLTRNATVEKGTARLFMKPSRNDLYLIKSHTNMPCLYLATLVS